MASLLGTLREQFRQEITQDNKFYKNLIYFFELQIPNAYTGFSNTYIFPLMLNPQSISFEEPFSVETTLTSEGGIWVEENGIVLRRMHIRGNTGFKPRKLMGVVTSSLFMRSSEKKTFSRNLPAFILDALSGQKHFQYLQDSVFRLYGDLKKDASTAKDTALFFHNMKDDEHWEVVPEKFSLDRSTPATTLYSYSIDLLVVAKATAYNIDFSEDKGLLDSIKDQLRQINNALQMVTAGIRDLTNMVAEIQSVVSGIGVILTSAVAMLTAVSEFVNGVTDLIEMPRKIVSNLRDMCENAFDDIEHAVDRFVADGIMHEDSTGHTSMLLPIEVHSAIGQIRQACDFLLMHPDAFETPLQKRLREIKDKQSLKTNVSSAELTAAALAVGPYSSVDIAALGTGLMPGDYNRAQVDITSGGAGIDQYTGLRSVDVEQSDTLVSLAARYLGDGRKWQDLAILNDLNPPYIFDKNILSDDTGFGRTILLGNKILVPNFVRPFESRPLLPVLGVPADAPADQRFLGSDFQLVKVSGNEQLYDLKVDADNGSSDFNINYGLDTLQQAILLRLIIEKGSDIMYKSVGLEPIVGLKWTPIDEEMIKLRIIRSVVADTRISGIQSATFTSSETELDSLAVDIKAGVFGFTQPAVVQLQL